MTKRKTACKLTLLVFNGLFWFFSNAPLRVAAQTNSNQGTEFWATFPTHVPDFDKNFNISLANISVFITGTQASSGKITAGSFAQVFTTAPNTVTEIQVPRNSVYIGDDESGRVLANRAIHITVDPGKPKIVVYTHIFAGQRSAATLLLPKEALGQQYYSINYQQYNKEGKNFINIVATEPNTQIHIRRGNTELVAGGITLNNVNDVYEYLSDEDLTGVSVSVDAVTSACKRFAVFSGSSGVYIGNGGCTPKSMDPLYQQCYPVDSWGNTYGFIPFSTASPKFADPVRTAGQYLRIVAKDDNTVITLNGTVTATLQSGQYYTTPEPLHSATFLSATKPVCAAQYALTQSCSNVAAAESYSDPDMVILNPIAFNIKDITVYSATRENITEQYINLLIKTAASPSFKVNGTPPVSPFITMTNLPGYSYLQLNLNNYAAKTFNLTADDGFNAIAYGFGDVESYAYSAGTNLAASHTLFAVNTATGQVIDTACTNDDFTFKLKLPYLSPQISWKMDDQEAANVQMSPTPVMLTENGQQVYLYSLAKTPAYQNPGLHHIRIMADYPNTIGGCNTGAQEIDDSFFTESPPVVDFSALPEVCENFIDFEDKSADPGHAIVGWLWDFGDAGPTASGKSQTHKYAGSGNFTVRLTVISATGCQSTATKSIVIARKITLAMNIPVSNCVREMVKLTDESQATGFITAARKWYLGNGDSVVTQSNSAYYSFRKSGIYLVKMVLTNAQGCPSDTLTQQISVVDKPSPDFLLPPACVTDTVQFTNKTVFPNDPDQLYSYSWNFGDPNATAANPNSATARNPTHHYSAARVYNVSLTVHSASGCDTTVTRQLTINGPDPKAAFSLLSNTALCINQPVVLKNNSRVTSFGAVTKLEWDFEIPGRPVHRITVTSFTATEIYNYYLPFADLTGEVSCTVTLRAYSGTSCADQAVQTFTLLPLPKVKFDKPGAVCINSPAIQLTQAAELTGVSGDGGKYYGAGVTLTGMFDPAAAGVGDHPIKYVFTSAGGCADSLTSLVRVLAQPTVTIKERLYLLPGETTTLRPGYSGSSLNYKWLPAEGLDHDTIAYPRLTAEKNMRYSITVANAACESTGYVDIIVLQPPVIYNTFTPNGDGVNDTWVILHLADYEAASIAIFNRYGGLVYRSVGYQKAWDGKYQGADLPAGTYYYTINLRKGLKPLSGYVTIIR